MNRNNDLETVELLMEKKIISNNDYYVNDINGFNNNFISQIQINENNLLYSFSEVFDKYINKFCTNSTSNDYTKVINDLIDGKIVIRDKKFFEILNVLKIFKYNEEKRMNFIEKIKNMDINEILKKIDDTYDKIYNDFYNEKNENDKKSKNDKKAKNKNAPLFDIDLDKIGIPHYSTYNYLMTFERKRCSLHIENNNLFLYYYLEAQHIDTELNLSYKFTNYWNINNCLFNKNDIIKFKINLSIINNDKRFGTAIDLRNKKVLTPYAENNIVEYQINPDCVSLNIISIPIIKFFDYFNPPNSKSIYSEKAILHTEHKYIESIFRYHNINLFDYLSEKYMNYKFKIYFNYKQELNEKGEEVEKSYVSLYMY